MKANTVVIISGKVCAPTVEYPEPSVFHEKQMAKFLSSCVPFEDRSSAETMLHIPDYYDSANKKYIDYKENHPYPVDEYEFQLEDRCQHNGIHNSACVYYKVAVLVDEKKEEKPDFKKLFEDSSLFNKHLKQQTTERGPIWVDDKGNEWVKKEQESQEALWDEAIKLWLKCNTPGSTADGTKQYMEHFTITRKPK